MDYIFRAYYIPWPRAALIPCQRIACPDTFAVRCRMARLVMCPNGPFRSSETVERIWQQRNCRRYCRPTSFDTKQQSKIYEKWNQKELIFEYYRIVDQSQNWSRNLHGMNL